MTQDDRIAELEAFAAVARTSSLSTAAAQLNLAVSSISRRLTKLERRLSVQLVERTTRRTRLTEAGRAFAVECSNVLDSYRRATEFAARTGAHAPSGVIRLSLPSSFGRNVIVPLLPAFIATHPQVTLELELTDRFVDIAAERFDVAIRIGPKSPMTASDCRLGVNRRFVCAAPRYLARYGEPTHPSQLERHRCLGFSSLIEPDRWIFSRGRASTTVEIEPAYRVNDADAIRTLAIAGEGIALQAEFNATDDLAAGRLKRMLVGWRLAESTITARVANARFFVPKRVEALIDYLSQMLPLYLRR